MSSFITLAFTTFIALSSAQAFNACMKDRCLQDFESAAQAHQYCDTLLGEASTPSFSIYSPVTPPSFAPNCVEQISGEPNQIQFAALASVCICANYLPSAPAPTSTLTIIITDSWSITTSGATATATPDTHSVNPSYIQTSSSSHSVALSFHTPTPTPSIEPPFTLPTNYFTAPSATLIITSSRSSSLSSQSNTTKSTPATCKTTITYNSAIYTFPCTAIPTLAPNPPFTANRSSIPTTIASSGSGVLNPSRNVTTTFHTSTLLTVASSQPTTNTPVIPSGTSTAAGNGTDAFTGTAAGRGGGRAGTVLSFLVAVAAVGLAL